MAAKTIVVPGIWGLEIANALLVGERRKRLRDTDVQRFLILLQGLSLVQDVQPAGEPLATTLQLARQYHLSAYDAAYLELSVRRDLPLATLDTKLKRAAEKAAIRLFG